ncbi:hypothetical protein V8C34DRAFT_266502, partial [Trichoderma compactum]
MQAQSSHAVSDCAISFLCIAVDSIHLKLASLPSDQSTGHRRLGRSPKATSVPSRKHSSCLMKRHRLPPCSITSIRKKQETDEFYARVSPMPDTGCCQLQES